MLNDTIGFIRDLPPKLIKSFSSTLEDSIESDLLLHVIDASDPYVEERIAVVNQILSDIYAASSQVSLAARSIADSSMSLATGASEQAASIEELNATIHEIDKDITTADILQFLNDGFRKYI